MVAHATVCGRPIDGHAYTVDEITRLRNFLKANASLWPDEKLYRHTDEFAVLVGLAIRSERELSTGDRIDDINSRLVRPAEKLILTLTDPDFSKEFIASWGDLRTFDADPLVDTLRTLVGHANKHVAIIRANGTNGKSWDSDLKDYFVRMVSLLCEFIDRDFEPTVKGPFSTLTYLLGEPLFDPEPTSNRLFFDGAIRKHVDHWNANKRLFQRMS
jgi:hypothetical protein